ncbi:FtsK/SpoIIIE domain-containing protein [Streptomyces sp. NPDC088732]|uniref:FtsK/SpoIIIE domain-containing protein n=1 Tax=Streptomyces sp. NPDC088732 TaxID=3365879 RepID=UPI0038265300
MTTAGFTPPRHVTSPITKTPSKGRALRAASSVGNASVAVGKAVCRVCGRLRYELAPAAATFGLTSLSWLHHAAGVSLLEHGVYGLATLAASGLTLAGLKFKSKAATHLGIGGAVMAVDTWIGAWNGPSMPSLITGGVVLIGSYAVYVPWLVKARHERIALQLKAAKTGAMPEGLGVNVTQAGVTGDTKEETALRRGLVALGIPAQDVSQIVFTDTGWHALVTLPAGKNTSAEAVIARQTQLEANMGIVGTLRLSVGAQANHLIVRVQTRDPLAETIPWPGPAITSCAEWLPLGMNPDGTVFGYDPLYNHVLVAGATDNGKSGVLNVILGNLAACKDAALLLVDMKPGAVELGSWSSCARALADTPDKAAALFDYVRREIKERGELMSQWRRETGVPVRKWDPTKHGRPALFIVIDELAELIRRAPELAKELESLKQIARFCAVQFIEATQSPSARVFGDSTDARQQYQVRIGLGVTESVATNLILGAGAHGEGWRLTDLDMPGKLMIASRDKDHQKPMERRGYYPSDADIAATVARYGGVSADGVLIEPSAPVDDPGPRGGGPGGGTPVPVPDAPAARPVLLRAVPTYPDGSRIPDNRLELWEALREAGAEGLTLQEAVAQGIAGHRTSVQGPVSQWVAQGWVDDSGKRGQAKTYVLTATAHIPVPATTTATEEDACPASL